MVTELGCVCSPTVPLDRPIWWLARIPALLDVRGEPRAGSQVAQHTLWLLLSCVRHTDGRGEGELGASGERECQRTAADVYSLGFNTGSYSI